LRSLHWRELGVGANTLIVTAASIAMAIIVGRFNHHMLWIGADGKMAQVAQIELTRGHFQGSSNVSFGEIHGHEHQFPRNGSICG